MKVLNTAIGVLALTPSLLIGFGVSLGPFSMQMGSDTYYQDKPVYFREAQQNQSNDNPFCYAVENHKALEVTAEVEEAVSDTEYKSSLKVLKIEPYLVGIDTNGNPILKGNILDQKVVREITVKYNDSDSKANDQKKKQGFFSRIFSGNNSDKTVDKGIDIRKVTDVKVLEDSNVKSPSDVNKLSEGVDRVICRISEK